SRRGARDPAWHHQGAHPRRDGPAPRHTRLGQGRRAMTTSRLPLTCDEVRDILAVQALEGHLARPDERVEAHCRDCEDCQAARRDYEDITGLLAFGLPEAPASPAARERLRARIASSRTKRRRRWTWPAAVAAACALSLALGVLIGALAWD